MLVLLSYILKDALPMALTYLFTFKINVYNGQVNKILVPVFLDIIFVKDKLKKTKNGFSHHV
jgi:hypothetical protein